MRKFPKVSEGLNRLLHELYSDSPPTQEELRIKEIFDSSTVVDFTWKANKQYGKPNLQTVTGMFLVSAPKTGEKIKYNYSFTYTYTIDGYGWTFAFSRKAYKASDVMMGAELTPEQKKTSNTAMVFTTVYRLIMKFLDEIQPYELSFEPYNASLEKAYLWMGKGLAKKISDTYTYETFSLEDSDTLHIYYRRIPRNAEVIAKYPEYRDLLKKNESIVEKITIPDLMKNRGLSPKALFFRKERYKIMGQEVGNSKFIECKLTRKGGMDFYFLAESTRKYKPGHKRKSADIKQGYRMKDNPSEAYQITIRVLDFLKWLDVYPDKKEITEKDIVDILMIANVEIDSDVPGWYWQGGTYWLQQIGGTIYKQYVRKPKKWNRPFPKGHGDGHYFLDKITQAIINSIRRYTKEMARSATEVLHKAGKL